MNAHQRRVERRKVVVFDMEAGGWQSLMRACAGGFKHKELAVIAARPGINRSVVDMLFAFDHIRPVGNAISVKLLKERNHTPTPETLSLDFTALEDRICAMM